LFAPGCASHRPPQPDVLAITDEGAVAGPGDPTTFHDDSVKFFDARIGARLATPGVPPDAGLAVNRNQFQPTSGEVRHYDPGGQRLPDHVRATAPDAHWAPRGAVAVGNKDRTRTLFIAERACRQ
jgi:hypothetical protein